MGGCKNHYEKFRNDAAATYFKQVSLPLINLKSRRDYFLPQHKSKPTLVSLLSTPATALPAIKVTPVSV